MSLFCTGMVLVRFWRVPAFVDFCVAALALNFSLKGTFNASTRIIMTELAPFPENLDVIVYLT